MRQLDCMMDNVAGSSRIAKQLSEVCVTAIEKLRQKGGLRIRGRKHFVVVDKVTVY